MLFNGGKLAGNEQMDRRFMFIKKKITPGRLSIDIYPRSQVSVYRTFGPLVITPAYSRVRYRSPNVRLFVRSSVQSSFVLSLHQ